MTQGWVAILRGIRATTLAVCLVAASFGLPSAAPAANCAFVLGFKTLHDLMPTTVGDCLLDEHHNPTNGDGLQETTRPTGAGGLLVWRKADNWTAYTDGYRTWINGPVGLQERLNTQCYAWEAGCSQPIVGPASALPGIQNFAQAWSHHGFGLTVNADGTATASWRTYAWCSNAPPPCDHFEGNFIVNGGSAKLVFYSVSGSSALAHVETSTDGATLSTGTTVTLTLLPYDQAQLSGITQASNPLSLCGPHFADQAPFDVLKSSPCGA